MLLKNTIARSGAPIETARLQLCGRRFGGVRAYEDILYIRFQCLAGTAVAACVVVSVHGLLERSLLTLPRRRMLALALVGKPAFCLYMFSFCTDSGRLLQLCGVRWCA